MKLSRMLFVIFLVMVVFSAKSISFAQSEPVMYFCEKYDANKGEIGISDRFTKGSLTVMVKCDHALNLENVNIEFEKYDYRTGKFEYYKKFPFVLKKESKYVSFSETESNDMSFDEPGFYRVFLLDDKGSTVTSALIEIIE